MVEAIKKEISQLDKYKVFCALKKGAPVSSGYKQITYHIVFDITFGLHHKAWLVANGNWADVTKEDIYSGIVAMDTVCIGFFVGELNGLKFYAGGFGNAYLNSAIKEKMLIIAGPEFGPKLEGRILIMVKAADVGDNDNSMLHKLWLSTLLQLAQFRLGSQT